MDPVFTVNYAELAVAKALHDLLPKAEKGAACAAYSITLPTSRQNKGWDLLAYSSESRRAARIQVKSSTWYNPPRPKTDRAMKRFTHYFWYNKFNCDEDAADFYALFGLYPDPSDNAISGSRNRQWWHHRILLFSASEMREFLKPVTGRFFDFGFDIDRPHLLYRNRGAEHRSEECYEDFLLRVRIPDLRSFLCSGEHAEPKRYRIDPCAA